MSLLGGFAALALERSICLEKELRLFDKLSYCWDIPAGR